MTLTAHHFEAIEAEIEMAKLHEKCTKHLPTKTKWNTRKVLLQEIREFMEEHGEPGK